MNARRVAVDPQSVCSAVMFCSEEPTSLNGLVSSFSSRRDRGSRKNRAIRCVARGCQSTDRDVYLMKFPFEPKRFRLWCEKAEFEPEGTINHYLCSNHFRRDQFFDIVSKVKLRPHQNPCFSTGEYLAEHFGGSSSADEGQASQLPPVTFSGSRPGFPILTADSFCDATHIKQELSDDDDVKEELRINENVDAPRSIRSAVKEQPGDDFSKQTGYNVGFPVQKACPSGDVAYVKEEWISDVRMEELQKDGITSSVADDPLSF